MKSYLFTVLFLLFPFLLISVENQPWFGNVYEFDLTGRYTYSYYHRVPDAITQLDQTSEDHTLYFDLEFPPSPYWSLDADIHFADTPRQAFSFSSTALQLRYLWLDDIIGDPISLTSGFSCRYTCRRSLKDISCPSHRDFDFQAHFAMGKEFDKFEFWRYRIWGYGGLGIANEGSPWMRAILSFETNHKDRNILGVFLFGEHCFGKKIKLNIDHFCGYGRIRSKYISIMVRYGLRINEWGTLRFEYTRRILAKRCPADVNRFAMSFLLPFSF